MLADGPAEDNRIVSTARQKVADLGFDFGSAVGAAQGLDGKNGVQVGPRPQRLQAGRLGAGEHPSTNQAAMRLVEGVPSGPLRSATAEAGLVEMLDDSLVAQRVIGLETQQVVGPARQDLLGDGGLAAHGVQRHDAVLQRKLIQQFRDRGDLVGRLMDATLARHEALLAQALTRCKGDRSPLRSNERRSVLPSMATTSRSKPSTSEPTQAANPRSKASGSMSMNTRRKVSCEGMPFGSSKKVRSHASLLRP